MTNPLKLAVIVIAAALVLAATGSAEEKPYFDFMNCELCKPFMEDPMLMQNVKMEQYEIESGVVGITTVDEKFLPSYRAAHAKMMKQIERLEKGDSLYLCGQCTAIGELMQKGMKYEYTETEHGDVSVMIADNPELVAEIKAVAAKGREEMKKMEKMMKEGTKK